MDAPALVLIKKFSLLFLLGLFLPSGASEMCETERGRGGGGGSGRTRGHYENAYNFNFGKTSAALVAI